MTSVRVCIVEDRATLLEALAQALSRAEGVTVAGSHLHAEAALAGTRWADVDILLADIDLPGQSGVELIRQVKALRPAVDCMAYTVYEDRATVLAAIRAGACGYLLKGGPPDELVAALRELRAGGAPMTPRVARQLLQGIQAPAPSPGPAEPLSTRELEVLRLIEQGHSYKEIAQALCLSAHTVHGHLKRIYEKFQAHGRKDAVARARELGVL